MSAERRVANRKTIDCINVSDLTSLNSYMVIARNGNIIDASTTGFLLEVRRNDIIPKELKDNLTLNYIVGQQVVLYLPQMNLDLDGSVIRTKHVGKGVFHIGIEFSQEVPEYWRQCLIDLLPAPGEFSK